MVKVKLFFACFLAIFGQNLRQNLFFAGQTSSVFKKANLVSMSKATIKNDRNICTKIVAVTFENEIGCEEVPNERGWKRYGFWTSQNLIIAWRR